MKTCLALVVGALSLVGPASSQQLTDVTLGHAAIPGLDDQCYEALNTAVENCPGILAPHSIDMPRPESPMLDTLCNDNCRLSLMTASAVIDCPQGSVTATRCAFT